MKIYNTMTKMKEEFEPIEKNKVKMYVCGPTVYNFFHIGNARPFIVFDAVRRYLIHKGYEVTFVQNYTDVDDKIINKAKEEGIAPGVISERYIAAAEEDFKGLNILEGAIRPKVTEEMTEIIEMVKVLIEKGYAYHVDGTVYFETNKFESYGKLSKKNLEDLEAGARISVNDDKRNPMDFVLWKPKKEGEIAWESPWGEGRPGWHIECSAMAKKYLGDSIDIHAGGVDLIFPHHENEIAQSEASNNQTFVKYWMHNEFINIDNKKMSKSLNNFFTVKDIIEKYTYEVVRFFMLSAHYRSPINFSDDLVEAAGNGLQRILNSLSQLTFISNNSLLDSISPSEAQELSVIKGLMDKFEKAMEDDFNTADAISAIFEIVKVANSVENKSKVFAKESKDAIVLLMNILGIQTEKKEEILAEEIEALIQARQQARKDKDFKRSDEIRDLLKEKGIVLQDTREGVKWVRE